MTTLLPWTLNGHPAAVFRQPDRSRVFTAYRRDNFRGTAAYRPFPAGKAPAERCVGAARAARCNFRTCSRSISAMPCCYRVRARNAGLRRRHRNAPAIDSSVWFLTLWVASFSGSWAARGNARRHRLNGLQPPCSAQWSAFCASRHLASADADCQFLCAVLRLIVGRTGAALFSPEGIGLFSANAIQTLTFSDAVPVADRRRHRPPAAQRTQRPPTARGAPGAAVEREAMLRTFSTRRRSPFSSATRTG